MPIFSLPSPYGIGTLGKEALNFIDFLQAAGQKYWQMLPVGPTGYGDSPYQSFSTFAGNPYFIDLEILVEEGSLLPEEITQRSWGEHPWLVDYEKVYQNRFSLLRLAFQRDQAAHAREIGDFARENASWVQDYALYMALKQHFHMACFTDWQDEALKKGEGEALKVCRSLLAEETEFYIYLQYQFFKQWERVKSYARTQGIGIIGDIPIYVSMDSADVWSAPEYFLLDENRRPIEVAGVPPDYFSDAGQLWGNPLYNWEAMKKDGYSWWIRRIAGAARLYDVLRIDHFRGMESYWSVPYGETTAQKGRWIQGPGMDLIQVLQEHFPKVAFIAEDLGYLTPQVRRLVEASGFPGMKILEFAFDRRDAANSVYLPHSYTKNTVCYTGPHDNATLAGWILDADPEDVAAAMAYFNVQEADKLPAAMLRGGMASVSDLFVAQMQDYLELGEEARINVPGQAFGNWRWRMKAGVLTGDLARKIRKLTELYGR